MASRKSRRRAGRSISGRNVSDERTRPLRRARASDRSESRIPGGGSQSSLRASQRGVRTPTRQGGSRASARRTRRKGSDQRKGPDQKIRYAVIGLGHIAQVAVLPAFKHAQRNSELAALVSDDGKKLQQLGKKYGAQRLCGYEDLDELYADDAIDAVYIALPNNMHAQYTVQAARAGKHVLCEKPMAVTSAECMRMIDACRENSVKLMIAYRLHFEHANLEAAEISRSGRIGDVRYFDSTFSYQVVDENIRVSPEEEGGGPLYDIGVYCINAARYLMGAEPTSVVAMAAMRSGDKRFGNPPETVSALLEFPNERIATFICSFGAAESSTYQVVGTKGSLRMDPAYEYTEGLSYELTIGERTRKKQFDRSDQFAPELLYFSECILQDREPEPSGKEGLADVRIIEAVRDSVRTGRRSAVEVFQRARRPSLRQGIRKPPQARPATVNVQPPHH